MKTITFECETITPMFLSGADGSTPELRPPSIKGALRFWWRAMNGHLKLEDLKRIEGEIFGGTGRRSGVIIMPLRVSESIDIEISTTPHHRDNYCNVDNNNCNFRNGRCMKSIERPAKLYKFQLELRFNDSTVQRDELEKIVKTALVLGGVGKRTRRGFGSIRIVDIDNEKVLVDKNRYDLFIEELPKCTSAIEYPFIKDIKIGKKYEAYQDILVAIGESSHNNKNNCLGYAYPNDRLASPIYASVIKIGEKEYYPIITTLKAPSKIKSIQRQEDFKNAIL